MRVVQTLRRGSYKLALGFTALVAALVMSMAAQAAAYSFNLSVGWKTFNTSYRARYYDDNNHWCEFDFQVGEYLSAAYTNMRIVNSNYGCDISWQVHTPGSQPAGNEAWKGANAWSSTSWGNSVSSAYTSFSWAGIIIVPRNSGSGWRPLYFEIDRAYNSGYYNGNLDVWCYGECST